MEVYNLFVGMVPKDGYIQVNVVNGVRRCTKLTFFSLGRTSHQTIIYVSVDSGSYDTTVFVWDIGGRKGTVYELHGHRQKVTFVRFLPSSKQLMTAGEDGNLVLWDMATTRIEV